MKRGEGEKEGEGVGLWAVLEVGLGGNMSGGKPVAVSAINLARVAIS